MEENIINNIIKMAKENIKTIVFPESNDIRILKACELLKKERICNPMLIGNVDSINLLAQNNNIKLDDINIVNQYNFDKIAEYENKFYEIRKHKGINLEEAKEKLKDSVYFATMMVKMGDADGMVCGACHTTSDTLRPALEIIKQKEGIKTVSSFFLMQSLKKELGANGTFMFSDCGLLEEPTEEQFVDIVNASVKSFKLLSNYEPKVALLSYSTHGSATSEKINKTKRVLERIREQNIDYDIDGELQLDAAIIEDVAKIKAPDSTLKGHANILIFPNLESGNIAYKIAQRFGDVVAIGPITQGLEKPVNDLSRGCFVDDIVEVAALTAVQAINSD